MSPLLRGFLIPLILVTPCGSTAMDQATVEADCRRAAQLDGLPEAEIPGYVANCLNAHEAKYGSTFDPAANVGEPNSATAEKAQGETQNTSAPPRGYGPNWKDRIGDMDAPPEHSGW